jgi:hypothetical protein
VYRSCSCISYGHISYFALSQEEEPEANFKLTQMVIRRFQNLTNAACDTTGVLYNLGLPYHAKYREIQVAYRRLTFEILSWQK